MDASGRLLPNFPLHAAFPGNISYLSQLNAYESEIFIKDSFSSPNRGSIFTQVVQPKIQQMKE